MPDEIPKEPRLTYTQLVNILCIVAVRLDRLETLMGDLLKGLDTQTEFQNYEILKIRAENMRENNRTPRRRLDDLEKQFNGLIQFVNNRTHGDKKIAEEMPF